MRLILLLFISALSLSLIAQQDGISNNIKLNCLAPNGLNLRKSTSINSAKILKIYFGESMEIIRESEVVEKIAGFEGKWIQVRFKDSIGYVFDVYTSHFPVPQLREKGYSYILDYMVENFKQTGGDKIFNIDEAERSRYNKHIQFNDIVYTFNNEGHDAIETVQIPNANIQECFIVFAASIWVFRKYSLDNSKFKRVKNIEGTVEYKSYDLQNPENSGEGYVYTYRLDDLGNYILIEIDFEWDLGGSWFKCKKMDDQSVKISHGYYSH
jgi:hypothetical protein